MHYARVRIAAPGPETPVTALAAHEDVDAVHLLAGGVADTDTPTYSLSIDGNAAAVRSVLEAESDVLEWDVASAEAGSVFAYVRFCAPPAVGALRERLTRKSLVVLLPATFRADGSVELTVVGTQTDLSTTLTDLPDPLEATILEVGPYRADRLVGGRALTARQREVLVAAFEHGYYDVPRTASHEDLAAVLECAPSTVGEHLRKAERRLVESALE